MSGGGGKGQTTTQVNYSPEEAAMRARVMGEAGQIYNQNSNRTVDWGAYNNAIQAWNQQKAMGKAITQMPSPQQFLTGEAGAPSYPGAKPVAASPDTVSAQNRLRDFSLAQGPQVAQGAADALRFGFKDVLNPASNPALQSTIDTATRKVGEAYTDPGGVLSQIRSNFISGAPGGQSSREGIAMGIAGRGYLNTIGDVTGQIVSDAYGKGLDTFGKTMAFAPNAYNLMTQPALTQAAVGTSIEGQQQAEEDYAAAARNWNINAPWMNLQNYANIVYGGASPGTTTSAQAPGMTNVGRAGMALTGAAMGGQVGGPYGAAAGAAIGLLASYL